MKIFFSERNFAVLLFVIAIGFFTFAQQDAKKVEMIYMSPATTPTSATSSPDLHLLSDSAFKKVDSQVAQ